MPDREVPSEAVEAGRLILEDWLDEVVAERPYSLPSWASRAVLTAALPAIEAHLHADLRERPKPGSVLVELTEEEAESVLTRIAESFHMEDGNPEADCVTCQAKAKLRAALSTSTKGGEGK